MLYARETLHYVALVQDLDRLSPFLVIPGAFQNKQDLSPGMAMPIQLCTGVKGGHSNRKIECTVACM